ncbi:hypothetical protein [Schleiferia thermophila]|jgi:hypothetical protein|uniref:Riboflavin synthase subunit beta n=1 Tax=Schleiferia thermophila TaxID=884107 RepID=A0A369AA66_9FLAO|nr:hypothetical protein [Schleiferia thermophila]RCX05288.1 hypothetical protein DES35_101573 [Schleiferia thermophila]GCD79202.1 hypothetical protein JCM30197_04490 [Schleiferia thermophila]
MSKFIFFRTAKPKGFHYKPLYYDASKERIEKLKRELESESHSSSEARAQEFGIRLKENLERIRKNKPNNQSGQNIRIFLILLGLLFIFYILVKPILGTS